jgi:hypothetical protein
MRRALPIGVAAAVVLLLVVAGGYTVYWFIAAARLPEGIGQWAKSLRRYQIDLSWQGLRVGGFPFAFRLEVSGVEFRDRAPVAQSTLRVARLTASAAPWNFSVWQLAAPDGLRETVGSGPLPSVTLSAHSAAASVLVADAGDTIVWLGLDQPAADAGVKLAARHAYVWLIMPGQPPQTDSEPAAKLAVDASDASLPAVPAPFHNPLDELAFAITVRGPVPTRLPPRRAAVAWRDAGGTADVDHFTLRSGVLKLTGSGTFALDRDLQPEGALSLAVEDYPALLEALVAAGRLRRDEAGFAGLALALLAKTGPDGEPEIATSLRMQDGEMFLGPVDIGPAPHIAW